MEIKIGTITIDFNDEIVAQKNHSDHVKLSNPEISALKFKIAVKGRTETDVANKDYHLVIEKSYT